MAFRKEQRLATAALLAAALAMASSATLADCAVELATYRDLENAASVEFTPTAEGAAVTNTFRMLLDNEVVLDGIVMWSEGIGRPYGMLTYKCPEGDSTSAELAACTMWEGVIYTSDDLGNIELLPPEAVAAPQKLIFPDLGPSLRHSAAYGANGFSRVPWDVFKLSGCQE
ncbi:MAG: hypothetical protein F9K19_16070 [Rhizobiaceae bacterium]|nr:MAG: hypothetical protein F9K19_16070 [Rhizobiaceae bacterium]CAG0955223.1 hypothetical protein RHIZO_00408 [Rhizobiaceae bacterium]